MPATSTSGVKMSVCWCLLDALGLDIVCLSKDFLFYSQRVNSGFWCSSLGFPLRTDLSAVMLGKDLNAITLSVKKWLYAHYQGLKSHHIVVLRIVKCLLPLDVWLNYIICIQMLSYWIRLCWCKKHWMKAPKPRFTAHRLSPTAKFSAVKGIALTFPEILTPALIFAPFALSHVV